MRPTLLAIAGLSFILTTGLTRAGELGNGEKTATIGAKCQTAPDGLAARWKWDLERLERLLAAKDRQASRKMLETKRAFLLDEGIEVYVEDRSQHYVQIRPVGDVAAVWVFAWGLNCPEARPKKGQRGGDLPPR